VPQGTLEQQLQMQQHAAAAAAALPHSVGGAAPAGRRRCAPCA